MFPLDVVDNEGNALPDNVPGNLVILNPIPTMVRDIYRDRERYINTYFSQIPGVYFTGDAAVRDSDGHYWVLGRTDDVINVAGHRISTMEMESALVAYKGVVEAAVIEQPDPIKGTVPVAFVILEPNMEKTKELAEKLKQKIVEEIGAFARPAEVHLVDALPRTRSGKIIRRMLRELVTSGTIKGDTTGLEDAEVLDQLMKDMKAPFAGEMSGHLFFADRFFGFDDAIYASARMVELVSRSNQKVSDFLADVPKYYSTPEIRAEVENDEIKFQMAAKAKEFFSKNYEVVDIDGVRIQFGDGWGLVRASNTQPVLVMRFEARTEERLEEIKNMVINKLKEFGEIKL